MPQILQVFLLAMTPIGELRLSIPIGMLVFHLNGFSVFFVSVIGNLAPAFLLLFFLKKVSLYLSGKSQIFKKIFTRWEENAKVNHYEKIQKYGIWGLFFFVAIPLPFTGAWTGSLLATMAGMPIKKSAAIISAGVIFAGVIVSAIIALGINIEKHWGWQALAGTAMFLGLLFVLFRRSVKSKN